MKKTIDRGIKGSNRILLASIAISSITTLCFFTIILLTSIDLSKVLDKCERAGTSKSADGIVVITESDLGCINNIQTDKSTKSLVTSSGIAGLIFSAIGLIILINIYSKRS